MCVAPHMRAGFISFCAVLSLARLLAIGLAVHLRHADILAALKGDGGTKH